MDRLTKKIIKLLDFPCEVLPPMAGEAQVLEMYERAAKEGMEQGFTPVIVVPGNTLAKTLKQAKSPAYYLEEYKKHDGAAILSGYLEEIKADIASAGEDWKDVVSDVEGGLPITDFVGFIPPDWDETLEVILAKVPTKKPWEVLAWFPIGGFSDCPPTEYMISILKKWCEEWQFMPVVICEDMIEGFAPKKPVDEAQAIEIATEHYTFCPDLIEQCCSDCTIGQWAHCLLQSNRWFFWWDA